MQLVARFNFKMNLNQALDQFKIKTLILFIMLIYNVVTLLPWIVGFKMRVRLYKKILISGEF